MIKRVVYDGSKKIEFTVEPLLVRDLVRVFCFDGSNKSKIFRLKDKNQLDRFSFIDSSEFLKFYNDYFL